jgi:hypothetical protein
MSGIRYPRLTAFGRQELAVDRSAIWSWQGHRQNVADSELSLRAVPRYEGRLKKFLDKVSGTAGRLFGKVTFRWTRIPTDS